MFTETKSQQYLKFPHSSSKFIKSQPLFSQLISKLTQTEKIITYNGWIFNKFAGGMWKFQIWLRFCLSAHTLEMILGAQNHSILQKKLYVFGDLRLFFLPGLICLMVYSLIRWWLCSFKVQWRETQSDLYKRSWNKEKKFEN